jgi:hypothetical protein
VNYIFNLDIKEGKDRSGFWEIDINYYCYYNFNIIIIIVIVTVYMYTARLAQFQERVCSTTTYKDWRTQMDK